MNDSYDNTFAMPPQSLNPHIAISAMNFEPRKLRTLVLCFDGTADQFAGQNTNVVKLYSLFKKDDSEQLCYYQPGIGTYVNPGAVSPLLQWGAKILDQGVAWYLDAHVRGGYQFLMQNYLPGDKICLFGFSRGAYTARALAGMLHKIGLLPRDNPEQIPFAYRLYKKTDPASIVLAEGFKKTFCRTVQIEFVGVWDTVASVGALVSRTLPFIANNTTIKTFRHALALDEHRAKFRPNLYHRKVPVPDSCAKVSRKENVTTPRVDDVEMQRAKEKKSFVGSLKKSLRKRTSDPTGWANLPSVATEFKKWQEEEKAKELVGGTDVLEVWFAGCHCDIGGSAVPDTEKLSLAQISLCWMVRQIAQSQCGIVFDHDALRSANIPQSVFTSIGFPITPPLNEKRVGSSSHGHGSSEVSSSVCEERIERPAGLDKLNAVQPIHDQLRQTPSWWLLEIMPTSYNWQDPQGSWRTSWCMHFGEGRHLPQDPNIHVTVKERMNDKALQYRPRASWKQGTERYVE